MNHEQSNVCIRRHSYHYSFIYSIPHWLDRFIETFFVFRAKKKQPSITRKCLEDFLDDLAKGFEKGRLKHITEYRGAQRSGEQIATSIAEEISESLAEPLHELFRNLKKFKKEQERTFSSDEITNHFIDEMIPNLASLHGQYSNEEPPSLKDCKDCLFNATKIKALKVLNQEQ